MKVVENALDFLRKHHLVSTMKLEPKLVGVHPSNRDGYGVNPQDVLDLVGSIVDVGFVGRVRAVGVEVEASTSETGIPVSSLRPTASSAPWSRIS